MIYFIGGSGKPHQSFMFILCSQYNLEIGMDMRYIRVLIMVFRLIYVIAPKLIECIFAVYQGAVYRGFTVTE